LITSEIGIDRPKLSPRQQSALDFIRQDLEQNGYAPTMRELYQKLGTKSTNGAFKLVLILERKGYIQRKMNGVHTKGFVLL
jgi:repressor LexA